jgi:hypothetical protein
MKTSLGEAIEALEAAVLLSPKGTYISISVHVPYSEEIPSGYVKTDELDSVDIYARVKNEGIQIFVKLTEETLRQRKIEQLQNQLKSLTKTDK